MTIVGDTLLVETDFAWGRRLVNEIQAARARGLNGHEQAELAAALVAELRAEERGRVAEELAP